jgi:general secretion pathway protein B
MSYILEAVKKVEKKEKQGRVPRLLSSPDSAVPRPGKRTLWPYLLIAALLLNAVVIFWWTGSKPAKQQTAAQAPAVQPPASAAPPALPPADQSAQSRSSDVKVVPQARDVSRSPAVKTRETPAGTPIPSQARVENSRAPNGRVLSLDELPPSVKSGLPEFKVSGHAYSPDPALRVTRINDQILQEGQSLIPGLKVEEIIPAGTVLSYRGYRFLVGTNAN